MNDSVRPQQDVYTTIAGIVADLARKRIMEGRSNKWMPIEGYAALMADKLSRWFETRSESEIEELVVDAFMLMAKQALSEDK